MKRLTNTIKFTLKKEKQNPIRLAYSILFLMSYLAVRGIIDFGHLFTVSPYHQKQ
ncbi:MAG: hypothetical protein KA213_03365 [Flavobacterium sp.]|nr:hypothetical protein [Flavobacterium sp.]